jgi:hypothetical protein
MGTWLRKYRWHLLVLLVAYAGISLWLFYFTDSPQQVPFEYQFD